MTVDTQHMKSYRMQQKQFSGRSIVIIAYIKKKESSQIKNLTSYLKELEKEEQTKLKVRSRNKIIKITAKINDIETRKTTERSMKLSCFLKR